MQGVKDLTAKFVYADNTMRNWKSYEGKVQGIGSESLLTLCDPQTSGGLLVAVAGNKKEVFEDLCRQTGVNAILFGKMQSKGTKAINIV